MIDKKDETKAIRLHAERTQNREHSTALYMTSSFMFEDAEQMRATFADEIDGNIYSRFSNPNADELVGKVVALEGAEAGYATASGMSAIFASFAGLLSSGDHLLVCRSIFGSTHTVLTKILPKWGISHTYVDINDVENWENSIKENTKMIYLETPSNPSLDIIDLEFVGKLSKKHGLVFNVDNCFATPVIQKPTEFGADLVVTSATKYMDGQGRVLGGVVVGKKELIDQIYAFCRSTGPAISPFNAWTLSKSLETLALRMERHSSNALKLATALESHPDVDRVVYPFLLSHPQYELAQKQMKMGGGLVTFFLKGDSERGKRFLDALALCSLTANLGDAKTIVSHPASTTHVKLSAEERALAGISDDLIRVSTGLENIIDIIADIEQAINKSK